MSHQPADAEVLAEAIRDKLGEKVNAPGLRALKAVLALQSDASLLQADVTKTFKTSKDSIRRYRDLVAQLPPLSDATAAIGGMTIVVAAAAARPLLSQDWLSAHLPNVQQVRVVSSPTISEDGVPFRQLEVDLVYPDGGVETVSAQARFYVEPEQEPVQAKRARQRANWNAEERAVRALDTHASAAHCRRERERKAAKREAEALVLYELGATQAAVAPPAGDPSWALPPDRRPRFIGEAVWVAHAQQLEKPRLGTIVAMWENGCCDVDLLPVVSPNVATPITTTPISTTLVSMTPVSATLELTYDQGRGGFPTPEGDFFTSGQEAYIMLAQCATDIP